MEVSREMQLGGVGEQKDRLGKGKADLLIRES